MRSAVVLLLSAASVLAGCGTGEKPVLDELSACANIHFAETPHVVTEHRAADFGAGRTLSVVVDVPPEPTQTFEQLSGLGPFTPGVPDEWRSERWMDESLTAALRTDTGNTRFSDYHPPFPARWVVVHDSGAGQRRIFVKAYCEGDAR
ncbi:hypothetical protein [Nocardia aurantia]|uniref:Lipoprotein n=1 Tax=Nocardia aurantia TaxID=2585199 RepID=A0A7K0DJS8_9NOCA|nr:hypothetical protein [Nocardia aurantia]MQY26063.1 hypothetical protein [Nocardia aurantia]